MVFFGMTVGDEAPVRIMPPQQLPMKEDKVPWADERWGKSFRASDLVLLLLPPVFMAF